jgi:hypothetical protein
MNPLEKEGSAVRRKEHGSCLIPDLPPPCQGGVRHNLGKLREGKHNGTAHLTGSGFVGSIPGVETSSRVKYEAGDRSTAVYTACNEAPGHYSSAKSSAKGRSIDKLSIRDRDWQCHEIAAVSRGRPLASSSSHTYVPTAPTTDGDNT